MFNKKLSIIVFGILLLALLAACNSKSSSTGESSDPEAETEANLKDEVNIGMPAQPPTLDAHMTTATVALNVARNIFETLVTMDENYKAVPMLADSVEKSDDGKTYTFTLREGVKFHNGKEMTSEDVVASMNRWLENSARAKMLLSDASFKADGESTVVLTLKNRASDVLDIMAGQGQFPAIMPKEIIEGADAKGVKEYIGTGPFKFVEWKQDQYIHLTKFEEYVADDAEPSGFSGKKEVFFNDLYYHVATDPSTRLAGLQTGQYDMIAEVPFSNYEMVKNDPNLQTFTYFDSTVNAFYNKKEGIASDPKIRQAINASLNMEEVLLASFANEDLFKLSPSYMHPDQKNWVSLAGKESYNQDNDEKAKKLLEEAGYNGELVRILVTRDYEYMYNTAVVLKEQLEEIGVKAELDIYDWATLLQRRGDPAKWDIFITGTGYVTTPSQLLAVNSNYPGWTSDPKITELLDKIRTAGSQEQAKKHWDELQAFLWNDYVAASLMGHFKDIFATTKSVKNVTPFEGIIPWNIKVTE